MSIKKGRFNASVGRYKNPAIVREQRLAACHKALQGVSVRLCDYQDITPSEGDFVYFDPPYHQSYTRYHKLYFTEQPQTNLRDFALELHKKGVKVMLSNSDVEFIRNLYKNRIFNVRQVQAPRRVNSKPGGRGNINEVLITNY